MELLIAAAVSAVEAGAPLGALNRVALHDDATALALRGIAMIQHAAFSAQTCAPFYGVAIKPLAVATIQRLPQRTIDSIRPTPGTVSPRAAIRTPSGPPRTAVPPRTSRTVHPSIVVGLVSGTGTIAARDVTEPVRSSTPEEAMLEETARS